MKECVVSHKGKPKNIWIISFELVSYVIISLSHIIKHFSNNASYKKYNIGFGSDATRSY